MATPSSVTVLVPEGSAWNGVAGARMMSTVSKSSRIASRNQARKRCAAMTQAAGTMAPERKPAARVGIEVARRAS